MPASWRGYLERSPKDGYETVVESWREIQSYNIEFVMKRLRERSDSPAPQRWCDQITTENQLCPYSEHSCAHRHSHGFEKLLEIEAWKSI
jgi:hypothetical protein